MHAKICALTTISKTMDWFIVDTMRNLEKNGYEITLICDMEEGFEERNKDYATCINIPMKRGVNLKDLIVIPLKLRRIFKENCFDIIYYSSPNVSLYASLAGILSGTKNRVYNQCGLRYISFKGVKRKIFWVVEKLTCSMSTTIRAQSPKNMKFAIDEKLCCKQKISVVGIGGTTGVDLSLCETLDRGAEKKRLRKEYGIPEDAFVFGYVGRINADKGINELITAFLEIKKKYENCFLVLVGMLDVANPITQESLRVATENPAIIMTGNVPPEQVYPHMAMFDVLTHPTYREGFGKVLQEAMGVGLPIITTDVPGPSEVVEDGISGILVEAKNVFALLDKMQMLYENDELREKLAMNGRERAIKFFDRPIMLNNNLQDFDNIIKSTY